MASVAVQPQTLGLGKSEYVSQIEDLGSSNRRFQTALRDLKKLPPDFAKRLSDLQFARAEQARKILQYVRSELTAIGEDKWVGSSTTLSVTKQSLARTAKSGIQEIDRQARVIDELVSHFGSEYKNSRFAVSAMLEITFKLLTENTVQGILDDFERFKASLLKFKESGSTTHLSRSKAVWKLNGDTANFLRGNESELSSLASLVSGVPLAPPPQMARMVVAPASMPTLLTLFGQNALLFNSLERWKPSWGPFEVLCDALGVSARIPNALPRELRDPKQLSKEAFKPVLGFATKTYPKGTFGDPLSSAVEKDPVASRSASSGAAQKVEPEKTSITASDNRKSRRPEVPTRADSVSNKGSSKAKGFQLTDSDNVVTLVDRYLQHPELLEPDAFRTEIDMSDARVKQWASRRAHTGLQAIDRSFFDFLRTSDFSTALKAVVPLRVSMILEIGNVEYAEQLLNKFGTGWYAWSQGITQRTLIDCLLRESVAEERMRKYAPKPLTNRLYQLIDHEHFEGYLSEHVLGNRGYFSSNLFNVLERVGFLGHLVGLPEGERLLDANIKRLIVLRDLDKIRSLENSPKLYSYFRAHRELLDHMKYALLESISHGNLELLFNQFDYVRKYCSDNEIFFAKFKGQLENFRRGVVGSQGSSLARIHELSQLAIQRAPSEVHKIEQAVQETIILAMHHRLRASRLSDYRELLESLDVRKRVQFLSLPETRQAMKESFALSVISRHVRLDQKKIQSLDLSNDEFLGVFKLLEEFSVPERLRLPPQTYEVLSTESGVSRQRRIVSFADSIRSRMSNELWSDIPPEISLTTEEREVLSIYEERTIPDAFMPARLFYRMIKSENDMKAYGKRDDVLCYLIQERSWLWTEVCNGQLSQCRKLPPAIMEMVKGIPAYYVEPTAASSYGRPKNMQDAPDSLLSESQRLVDLIRDLPRGESFIVDGTIMLGRTPPLDLQLNVTGLYALGVGAYFDPSAHLLTGVHEIAHSLERFYSGKRMHEAEVPEDAIDRLTAERINTLHRLKTSGLDLSGVGEGFAVSEELRVLKELGVKEWTPQWARTAWYFFHHELNSRRRTGAAGGFTSEDIELLVQARINLNRAIEVMSSRAVGPPDRKASIPLEPAEAVVRTVGGSGKASEQLEYVLRDAKGDVAEFIRRDALRFLAVHALPMDTMWTVLRADFTLLKLYSRGVRSDSEEWAYVELMKNAAVYLSLHAEAALRGTQHIESLGAEVSAFAIELEKKIEDCRDRIRRSGSRASDVATEFDPRVLRLSPADVVQSGKATEPEIIH